METIEKSIDIDCPVRAVYDQWIQFEKFPEFMEGVKTVRQVNDKSMLWEVEIAGRTKIWEAEIFEQRPDERIAWRSMSGTMNSGMVNFEALDSTRTRMSLRLSYKPQGIIESMGVCLGLVSARVSGDLKRFKEWIEYSQSVVGGWRGEVEGREGYAGGKPESFASAA